jgi:hypothetical protein
MMKTRIDLEDAGIDPDCCCYCGTDKTWTDRYGLPWCDEHKHRGKLLNWGLQHQWLDLKCWPYAIGPGEWSWYIAAVAGLDELIWMALAAVAPQVEIPAEILAHAEGTVLLCCACLSLDPPIETPAVTDNREIMYCAKHLPMYDPLDHPVVQFEVSAVEVIVGSDLVQRKE